MKKIIITIGKNSQTIFLLIILVIGLVILLNTIAFFYKKHKNPRFSQKEFLNNIFYKDQSQVYVLVRKKDYKVLFFSSHFEEVFHILPKRIQVDIEVLKEIVEDDAYRQFLKEYKQHCVDNHIDNIIFKGFVDSKYIPYILSKADACLLHGEMTDIMQYGMSTNKSFMYLASGKPIISTYPNKYDFIDDKCGITVKSDNNKEYIDAVMKIYNLDDKTKDRFRNNSLKLIKEFDYKELSNKLISLIIL